MVIGITINNILRDHIEQLSKIYNIVTGDEPIQPINPFDLEKSFPTKQNDQQISEFKVNEEQTKCYCKHTTYCDCGPEEPKQETLEEAAEKAFKTKDFCGLDINPFALGYFIAGAKWQKERSYSEEDVLDFGKYLLQLSNSAMSKRTNMKMLDLETGIKLTKDLFEQFKKK